LYSHVLTTNIQQPSQEDSLKQTFQVDTTAPTLTGTILPNTLSNTGVSFPIIHILDASFSGATLEMIPEFTQIGTIKTLTGTSYTG
jgi:hypothetical protein